MRAIHVYVGSTVLLALVLLSTLDWSAFSSLPNEALLGLVALTVLGVVSEASAFSYKLGQTGGSSSLAFIPLVAAAILFGPVPAVTFILLTVTIGEFLIRKKPLIRATFNVAQYVNATVIAGLAFSIAGGYAVGTVVPPPASFDPQLLAVLVFGVTSLLLNQLAVAVAIALNHRESLKRVLWMVMNRIGGTVANDLMVLPIAVLVAFLYFELGVTGLFVSLLPLIVIRYSYLATFRLQAANRDLLKVLVKAIETRDPYTSGHSLRVQALARSIAEHAGMSSRRLEELETAALLHDIGKIEVVYEKILQKPGDLSEAEREMIQSHVHRGVEILTSLSSFDSRIVSAVRHHHELYDGTGYPDGLKGKDIPLLARIIKLSDAIDAMLSSRPYRDALPIETVKSELLDFAGKHFDPKLVEVVVGSQILEEHVGSIQLETNLRERDQLTGSRANDRAAAETHHA
jgi:putative nucleotidyltransferase with HDIG domain